jgi:AcrR family transcriptional regulator
MTASLRQEHRDATRRRIISAARRVFVKKGYAKATIEDITIAAGLSRATLYQYFSSKLALLDAATERMRLEAAEAAQRLVVILAEGDHSDLRAWIEWSLSWYVRNRPIALAAHEAELSQDKPPELLLTYLEKLEPWVATWPVPRQPEARTRFELCRLQMQHYMWGKSYALFDDQGLPVDLFTEIWWNTLKAPATWPADRP